MESRKDDKEPNELDEAEYEQREYSSPPCYLHEFEKQETAAGQPCKEPKPAADPAAKPKSPDTP